MPQRSGFRLTITGQNPCQHHPTHFASPVMTASEFDPPTRPSPGAPSQSGDAPLREALRPSGPPRFGLRVERQAESVVAYVDGELDILTTPKLAARINGVIRRSSGDLVIDLRAVEFIDSAGLNLLLNTRRRLMRKSRALSVVCEEGPVKRLIELMRLIEALDVKDS